MLLARDAKILSVLAAGLAALPVFLQLPPLLSVLLVLTAGLGAWSQKVWPSPLRFVLTFVLIGLVLSTFAFGFGRDTATALLLAMLALKCCELGNRRDALSLVGFSLFAPFSAFLQDQGPLTLLLGMVAAVALLLAMERLAQSTPVTTADLRTRLRRMGVIIAIALPLALVGFWLFPRLSGPLWGMPDNAIARTGLSDTMSPGEWLDLMNDDRPAFRVRFTGPVPPVEQMYWRGPVLSNFDGRTWSASGFFANLPPPPTVFANVTPWRYEITLEPLERPYVLVLDVPVTVTQGTLGGDASAKRRHSPSGLLRYEGVSAIPTQFEPELKATLRASYVRLPDGFNPRTRAMVERWRAEGADDVEVIRRLLTMIQNEFSYSLAAPELGRNSIDEFIFDTKIGFCEHYSAAFVFVMRAANIPARVVTGYAGAQPNGFGDFWLVRQSDAHAWAEVWLQGRGWIRVDPTAAVAPERVFETVDDLGESGAAAAVRGLFDLGDWARSAWNNLVLQFDSNRQRSLLQPLGIDEADSWQLSLAFAVAAAIALLVTLLLMMREHRGAEPALVRAWRVFSLRLRRAGLARNAHEPPLSYGKRLAEALPAQADEVRRLSQRYAEWRYAGETLDNEAQMALTRELRRWRRRRSG